MAGYCSSTVQGIGGWLIYLATTIASVSYQKKCIAGFDPLSSINQSLTFEITSLRGFSRRSDGMVC